jgi:hypothetical protein
MQLFKENKESRVLDKRFFDRIQTLESEAKKQQSSRNLTGNIKAI